MFLDDLNLKHNETNFENFSVDNSFESFLNVFINVSRNKNTLLIFGLVLSPEEHLKFLAIFTNIVSTHAPQKKCTRKEKN